MQASINIRRCGGKQQGVCSRGHAPSADGVGNSDDPVPGVRRRTARNRRPCTTYGATNPRRPLWRLAVVFLRSAARCQAPARASNNAERQSDDFGITGCNRLIQITFDQLGAGEVVGGVECFCFAAGFQGASNAFCRGVIGVFVGHRSFFPVHCSISYVFPPQSSGT